MRALRVCVASSFVTGKLLCRLIRVSGFTACHFGKQRDEDPCLSA